MHAKIQYRRVKSIRYTVSIGSMHAQVRILLSFNMHVEVQSTLSKNTQKYAVPLCKVYAAAQYRDVKYLQNYA